MAHNPPVTPDPFHLNGGPTGILLIHGFTGSPAEMRPLAEELHRQGLTVSAPLLPGHGTTPEQLNRKSWHDWHQHVDHALARLQDRCETTFVAGLSLGSLLALHLAVVHQGLPGIILYSPATMLAGWRIHLLPVFKYLIPLMPKGDVDFQNPQVRAQLWSYDVFPTYAAHEVIRLAGQVRRSLPAVTCPALIIYSPADEAIHPTSAEFTYEHLGSVAREVVILQDSGHVVTLDNEWERVAAETYRFLEEHQSS